MPVLNVGAGTGSYEPEDRSVISLDPSIVMLKQRRDISFTIRGVVEHLPFLDEFFEAAMAVLSIDHWTDKNAGIKELERVVKSRIVIFAWDRPQISNSWLLCDYFPASKEQALRRTVPIDKYVSLSEGSLEIIHVPIPWDCHDGFDGAYWRRPFDLLDPHVWQNMSTLTLIPEDERQKGLDRLAQECQNGEWKRKYGHLLNLEEYDMGYRLLVWRKKNLRRKDNTLF